ncbi:MAG: hypothetical protein ACOC56_02300 [Atribacterota bacterium]
MTTELKTLKDFDERNSPLFNKENLKAEAVKRAKYFKKMIKQDNREDDLFWFGRLTEVKEFNNLTEEDVNENKNRRRT